jgi:hypothetical protein
MAAIRLSGGSLFVWSPVALTEDLRAEVDALGEVRYLVAPNSLHHGFGRTSSWIRPDDISKMKEPEAAEVCPNLSPLRF